jgi:hypothetical protein
MSYYTDVAFWRLFMPIPQTALQLETMLRQSLPSISADGIRETVRTAIFINVRLAGLDLTYLRLAPREQQDRFFRLANARMGQLGDPNGGRVYENYYPTGGNPPCVLRNTWTCWVAANDPWEP